VELRGGALVILVLTVHWSRCARQALAESGWAPDPGVDVEDEADVVKLCDGTGVPERRIFRSVDL
jgi:hypothetical protein